jgi:hypothetical protein
MFIAKVLQHATIYVNFKIIPVVVLGNELPLGG